MEKTIKELYFEMTKRVGKLPTDDDNILDEIFKAQLRAKTELSDKDLSFLFNIYREKTCELIDDKFTTEEYAYGLLARKVLDPKIIASDFPQESLTPNLQRLLIEESLLNMGLLKKPDSDVLIETVSKSLYPAILLIKKEQQTRELAIYCLAIYGDEAKKFLRSDLTY